VNQLVMALATASIAGALNMACLAQSPCDADLDHDGTVAGADLALVLGDWGPCKGCQGDVTNNGVVDGIDLAFVLTLWGGACSPVPWATVLEQLPDPAVVYDADLRTRIMATGLPWRVRDNGTNIELVLIPPGTFNMGCSASNAYSCPSNESPVHSVTLTSGFYMGRYEVTQAQWQARMGSNPSYFISASAQVSASEVPNRPVEQVSWETIQSFLSAAGMRLPTEAEWEYAYRAGTSTAFHGFIGYPHGTNDDTSVENIAWLTSNSSSQTRPVGGKAANGYGVHDLSGNVYEWVSDWFGSSYYAASPSTNPEGPSSGYTRGLRGGNFASPSGDLRSSIRGHTSSFTTSPGLGFRVARNP